MTLIEAFETASFFLIFAQVIATFEYIRTDLLFLDISFGEIFIIVAVIFIIFGPQKIPEIARKIGKGMREVKKASTEITREINREANTYKTDLDMERMVNEADKPGEKEQAENPEKDETELNKKSE